MIILQIIVCILIFVGCFLCGKIFIEQLKGIENTPVEIFSNIIIGIIILWIFFLGCILLFTIGI